MITNIHNAVASGKLVTTSEKSINFNGWKGSGYIIIDPNTGSGAYMISGGLNGGQLPPLSDGVAGALTGIAQAMFIFSALGIIGSLAVAGAPILAIFALLYIVFVFSIILYHLGNSLGENAQECREAWFGYAGAVLGFSYAGSLKAVLFGGVGSLITLLFTSSGNSTAMACWE